MQLKIIRYKTKPEGAEENQRLIEGVFRELRQSPIVGVDYLVIKADQDVFVHVVRTEAGDSSALTQLDSFKAFQADFRARCADGPQVAQGTLLGDYRATKQS